MRKRILKLIALVVAIILIIGICSFANSLVGNPISKMLAQRGAEDHLKVEYTGTDYFIERVGFNFKFGCYYAHIRSRSSVDTQFTLYINMIGKVYHDTYEDVLSGAITARRLDQEYRELTDQVFESPSFPYLADIGFGELCIYPEEAIRDPEVSDIPSYALVRDELILDHVYDIRELGARAGRLVVYVESDRISVEDAAEIMLNIREQFDKANVPFRAIDFVLQLPLPEEGPRPDEEIRVENFLYEDIYEEGMIERVTEADQELKAYYAEQDALHK